MEKTQRAGATHHPGERSLQRAGEWVAQRPAGVTGRKGGQGQKQQCHWEAPKRKRGSPKGICTGLEPRSTHHRRNGLFWELGNPRLAAGGGGAEIHTGLLCPGRARNKAGCCQPPHGRRPWREVGLPSSLDTRQVSNKQALSAARVWHSSVRSTHNPTSAEPPAARPAHQSTLANAVPPD